MRVTFYLKSLNGRGHLEDTGLDGMTELKWSFKEGEYDELEWIHVARYMEERQRRGLGKWLMNLRIQRVRLPPC
jgi:uncharacterized SAM-dependent methyltransferase